MKQWNKLTKRPYAGDPLQAAYFYLGTLELSEHRLIAAAHAQEAGGKIKIPAWHLFRSGACALTDFRFPRLRRLARYADHGSF